MYVTQKSDKVGGFCHRFAPEAVVKQRAETVVTLVEVTHIGNTDALHRVRQWFCAFGYKQVNVISHQAICVNVAVGRQRLVVGIFWMGDLTQYFYKFVAVVLVGKNRATVDTA